MALKITKDSKFIKGTLTNGEVLGVLFHGDRIPFGHYKHRNDLKEIIIPEGITSIDSEAFFDCASLTTITFPESLRRIEYNAFVGCTSLQKIVLPSSLREVEFWFDRGTKYCPLSLSSNDIIKNLLEGYAMDLYHNDEWISEHIWD